MGQPGQEVIIAGPLVEAAVAYRNRLYVADRVAPLLDGIAPEAKLLRVLKGAWFRDEATMMGPGSEAGRGGYRVDWLDVILKRWGFAKEVTDDDRAADEAMGGILDPDRRAIEFATDKVLLKREVRVASLIKTTAWSGESAGGEDAGGLWAAGSGNTFLADVKARKTTIQNNTGFLPNCLLIDNGTYESLTEESTVLDKIKYTQLGVLTKDLLAAILDLDEVIVAGAVTSSAKESKAGTDFTAARIWENTATKGMGFLFYRAPAPARDMPSSMYMARGRKGAGYENGFRLSKWREDSKHQDVYEVAENMDIVVTGADLGFMWKDTLLT